MGKTGSFKMIRRKDKAKKGELRMKSPHLKQIKICRYWTSLRPKFHLSLIHHFKIISHLSIIGWTGITFAIIMLRLIKKLTLSNILADLESKQNALIDYARAWIKTHQTNTFKLHQISQVFLAIIDAFLNNCKTILV